MAIGLHHLRYFVAVADEGNVTRAAARLHIAQPSLSAQIKYLEDFLGVRLFTRHRGGMELTKAGALFLVEARESLRSADAAVRVARMAARAQAGTLRIGLIVGTYVAPTTAITKAFQARHPQVALEFAEYTFADPAAGLNARETDLGFVQPPFTHQGLRFLEIYSEPRVAVLAENHPLAGRTAISVRELFDEPWIVADTDDQVCRDFWLATDHRNGVPPKLGPVTRTMDTFIRHVQAGEVVGLAEASMEQAFPRPGIRYVPVTDVQPVPTCLAWRPDAANPLVDAFVETAEDHLAG